MGNKGTPSAPEPDNWPLQLEHAGHQLGDRRRSKELPELRLPAGIDGAALKRELYDRHRIEVPIVETRDGWAMRVSIQAYNDEGDVDALLRALT